MKARLNQVFSNYARALTLSMAASAFHLNFRIPPILLCCCIKLKPAISKQKRWPCKCYQRWLPVAFTTKSAVVFVDIPLMSAGIFRILKKCYMTMASYFFYMPMAGKVARMQQKKQYLRKSSQKPSLGYSVRCSIHAALFIHRLMQTHSMRTVTAKKARFMCGSPQK